MKEMLLALELTTHEIKPERRAHQSSHPERKKKERAELSTIA